MAGIKGSSLSKELIEHVYQLPQGKRIDKCIQCGTCSGSCPTSGVMEYGPREIIAALRAGMLDRVLRSNTVWLCASCYSCAVRCPAKIPFTDVMYELKRLGVKHGIHPRRDTNAVMSKVFTQVVSKYGRNVESELAAKYFLGTNPLRMLGQTKLVMKLLTRHRLNFTPHKIKGIDGLRKMIAATQDNGAR